MRWLAIGLGILAILAALGGDAEAWIHGGAASIGAPAGTLMTDGAGTLMTDGSGTLMTQ